MPANYDENELLKRAIIYLQSLSNGFNPLDGRRVSPSDIVMVPKISRCLAYSASRLENELEALYQQPAWTPRTPRAPRKPREPRETKPQKPRFAITDENRSLLHASDKAMPATNFMRMLTEQACGEGTRSIGYSTFVKWMASIGMLEPDENGKMRPTEQGSALGIFAEDRVREESGEHYSILLYPTEAQQFIIDNIDCVIELWNGNKD